MNFISSNYLLTHLIILFITRDAQVEPIVTPEKASRQTKNFPNTVLTVKSPYPNVVNVTVLKYYKSI